MSIKATRGTDFQQLTATVAVQSVTLPNSYRYTIVKTLSTDGIRISINDIPATLSGSLGILVQKDYPLKLDNHLVHSIGYIREIGAAGDVVFDLFGLYHERNTSPISDEN